MHVVDRLGLIELGILARSSPEEPGGRRQGHGRNENERECVTGNLSQRKVFKKNSLRHDEKVPERIDHCERLHPLWHVFDRRHETR